MVWDGDLGGRCEKKKSAPHVPLPGLLPILDGPDDLPEDERSHVEQDVVEEAEEGRKSKRSTKGLGKDGQGACLYFPSLFLLLLLFIWLVVSQEGAEDAGDIELLGDGRQVLEAKGLLVALEEGWRHPSKSDPRGKSFLVLRWVGRGPIDKPLELCC